MPEVILGGIPKAQFRVTSKISHAPSQPSNESLLPLHLRGGSVMILMRGYEGQSHRTPSDQVVLPSKAQTPRSPEVPPCLGLDGSTIAWRGASIACHLKVKLHGFSWKRRKRRKDRKQEILRYFLQKKWLTTLFAFGKTLRHQL